MLKERERQAADRARKTKKDDDDDGITNTDVPAR